MVLRFLQERFSSRPPDVETLKAKGDTARLLSTLRRPEPAARKAAAVALGQVGGPEAVPALLSALSDTDWAVRRAAVRALGERQGDWIRPHPSSRGKDQPEPDGGAESPGSQMLSEPMDRTAHSHRVAEALDQLLRDEIWQVREAATETLGEIAHQTQDTALSSSLSGALLVSLGDERLTVRKAAARALAGLGPNMLRPLDVALNEPDWNRREGAAFALGLLGQRLQDPGLRAEVVTILTPALTDSDPRPRIAAVKALGQIGQCWEDVDDRQQVLEWLSRALDDPDGQVRESAVRALGRIGDARVARLLVQLLQDPKSSVRDAAAQALDRLARAQGIHTGPVRP